MLIYFFCGLCTNAQEGLRYRTEQLEKVASRLSIKLANTTQGYSDVGLLKGHPLVAACDTNGVVTHLGLKLFGLQVREGMSTQQIVIVDFLERYFLDLLTQRDETVQEKLQFDKILFRNGTVNDLMKVTDIMPFTISVNDGYYEVEWINNDNPVVTIAFQAQYELLLGMPSSEIQSHLKDFIRSAKRRLVSTTVNNIQPVLQPDGIYVTKDDYYQLESMSNATYYYKVGGEFVPVFDDTQPEYSASNLLQGIIADDDYRLHIEQSVYGMTSVKYMISLRQWLDYQASQGLKVFVGMEEQREDGLLMLVVAQNKDLGYNHLLSIVIPDGFTKDRKAILKARLSGFIPTHNLKNLYQQEFRNRKKTKWQ